MLRSQRKEFRLVSPEEPELFREQFPYDQVPRILFDHFDVPLAPPADIWITDTTFRDGQQSRPPYKPEQIVHLYDLLHKLGGPKGIVRQCEYFLYSVKDRQAVEGCLALGRKFPEVTGWIRANEDDFKLVKSLGLKETGILTSVSDYHIYLKLKKDRASVMEDYLRIVRRALEEGICPRCHFEDITKADIYGFCLPFAAELLKLSQESGIPVKIRLCDTMGYGVTYPGAVLPRSVPKLIHAFNTELGYPSHLLEWHGHNDFHKVHINGATAWLHGCAALNTSLLGFGERTGNSPLEGAVMEYIGLKGADDGMDTRVISEIADYFVHEIKAPIPANFPFVGAEFNTTRAGIHADGLLKNEEIYNIFDTGKLLNRPLRVMVTDKSGMAGIARWLNENISDIVMGAREPVSKRHPGVKYISDWVTAQYEQGRTTSISPEELVSKAKHYLPSLFESDFIRVRKESLALAERLSNQISQDAEVLVEDYLKRIIAREPSIQLIAVTDLAGRKVVPLLTQRGEKGQFRRLGKRDFNDKEWFQRVVETGKTYQSDLFFSEYTRELILTTAVPLRGPDGDVAGVIDIDFKFDDLAKMINDLPVKDI